MARRSFHKRLRRPTGRLLLVSSLLVAAATERLPAQSSSQANPCHLRHKSTLTLSVQGQAADTVAEIRVLDVRFEGTTNLALSEQNAIAAEIMGVVDDDRKGWLEEMQDRVKNAWQTRGFFKVEIQAQSRELSSSTEVKSVALTFHVDAGVQYRLSEIRFKNGNQFGAEELRRLFPINDGEILNVEKIGQGMEALREAYGEIGFINFTAVPETRVDEQGQRVALDIDLDEGKQFHIAGVEVPEGNHQPIGGLLREYRIVPGEVFDFRRLEELARELNLRAEYDIERRIDEKNAAVCLLIHLLQP